MVWGRWVFVILRRLVCWMYLGHLSRVQPSPKMNNRAMKSWGNQESGRRRTTKLPRGSQETPNHRFHIHSRNWHLLSSSYSHSFESSTSPRNSKPGSSQHIFHSMAVLNCTLSLLSGKQNMISGCLAHPISFDSTTDVGFWRDLSQEVNPHILKPRGLVTYDSRTFSNRFYKEDSLPGLK